MTAETITQVTGFLGLCTRAGQMVFGQDACVNAVRKHGVQVVLLDTDCSKNTQKRFLNACETHETCLYYIGTGLIAQAVGKDSCMVAAVKRGAMGEKVLSLLKNEQPFHEKRLIEE